MEYMQYTDMSLKEIQETFQKSAAAVGMAVKRMIDRTGNEDWKYKNGKTVMIKAEGVLWLAENYFITPFEISNVDPEKIRLEEENKHLKLLLEAMKEQYQYKLSLELEKQALKLNSKRLLIERDINTLTEENKELRESSNELRDELNSYQKSLFGFYRKKK